MAPDIITLHALSKDRNTTETDLTVFDSNSNIFKKLKI